MLHLQALHRSAQKLLHDGETWSGGASSSIGCSSIGQGKTHADITRSLCPTKTSRWAWIKRSKQKTYTNQGDISPSWRGYWSPRTFWLWRSTAILNTRVQNIIVSVVLQYLMLNRNVSQELPAWPETKPMGEPTLYRTGSDLLSTGLEGKMRAKGRKLKKCKILTLFKEELSNNLFSPKMGLAYSSRRWASLLSSSRAGWPSVGDGRGPSTGSRMGGWLSLRAWEYRHWLNRSQLPKKLSMLDGRCGS